ncbi:MAG: elongation factor Tu [Euryarchaeota archaeon RBG_13_57_23]|nr:MAG: elongation factor Tu [Euryarchaeota archaeon RBG_13_57_23]
MPNLNVAVIGSPDYAKGLGKKSTASDITFYDLKRDEVTVSLVEPSKYPEKLASLFFATSLADVAVIVVEQIGPAFGESVVMLDSVGVKKGYIVTKGYITRDQLSPLIKGTVLEKYTMFADNPVQLRERLLADAREIASDSKRSKSTTGSVAVDHYFDVKGVGTVVLGCVADGVIKRHDAVNAHPIGKEAEIRSIQKHDDDFERAEKGDRVGLALKGISVSELDRGTVLSNDDRLVCRKDIAARAHLVKYWLNPLREDMVAHIGHWMQFEPARIESITHGADWRNPRIKLNLQKELVYLPGSKAILAYLEGGKLRIIGTLDLQ